MTQTLSLRAVLCATTLVSPFLAQAATETEVEALKKNSWSCANATRPSRTP